MKVLHLEGTPHAWTFHRFGDACRELGIVPTHVLHVGGHLGQEVDDYRAAGAKRITYMEPTPELAMHLRDTYGPAGDVEVVQAAAGPSSGWAELQLCGGDGAWNTIREQIGSGAGVHGPVTKETITVDVVPIRVVQHEAAEDGLPVNVLVVDTQGTEVEALQSADFLPHLQLVIVETQSSGHPEAAHVADVDARMAERGWIPVLAWNHEHNHRPHATFADVFYVPASAANVFDRDR